MTSSVAGCLAHPTIEVRVYHYGMLKVCEWCTSPEEARRVAQMWDNQRAMRCEIVEV